MGLRTLIGKQLQACRRHSPPDPTESCEKDNRAGRPNKQCSDANLPAGGREAQLVRKEAANGLPDFAPVFVAGPAGGLNPA